MDGAMIWLQRGVLGLFGWVLLWQTAIWSWRAGPGEAALSLLGSSVLVFLAVAGVAILVGLVAPGRGPDRPRAVQAATASFPSLRLRAAIALLVGLCGAALMLAAVPILDVTFGPGGNRAALVVFAGLGAGVAGAVTSRWFGQDGWQGVCRALLGAVLATTLGAILGVVLASLHQHLFEPVPHGAPRLTARTLLSILPESLMILPLTLVFPRTTWVWLLSFALVHLVAGRLRRRISRGSSGCP
jgi:hypothetical protein